ncbi:DUF2079 domain-containing protein [Streptomyces lunaelactis]|nr:DUF2079 domain-containing protein [Streptomyces lunaelactis]
MLPAAPPPLRTASARPRHDRRTPVLVAAAVFAVYTVFALRLHAVFGTTGYDLGIFEQAVRSYAAGDLPDSEIRTASAPVGFTDDAFPLFADHFHPVLAVLAPLYRLLPHPELLLVVQAALIAVSAYAVSRAAARHVPHPAAGPVLGAAYAFSWGLQQLIGFDFHEVAFAVPLLALAGAAYLNGRWAAAAWWAGGLILIKEDLGATLLVLGLLLWRHHRRAGAALCVLGPVSSALAVLLVIPAFAPDGAYAYATFGDDPLAALDGWGIKAATIVLLLGITAGLSLLSPLVLLAVPTLAWRFLSPNTAYWGPEHHYSAVLMPIVFLALIDAVRRLPDRGNGKAGSSLVRRGLAVPALVAVLLLPALPFRDLADPGFWRDSPRRSATRAALALIPDGARVAASNHLAPHLTNRATVHLATHGVFDRRPDLGWLIADTNEPWPPGGVPAALRDAEARGWRTVYARDGVVILRPDGPAGPAAVSRGRRQRRVTSTQPAKDVADVMDRFRADPDVAYSKERWVADFTYVATWSGIVYVAFVVDVFSRAIVGWSASASKRAKLVLDALDMALWRRDRAGNSRWPGAGSSGPAPRPVGQRPGAYTPGGSAASFSKSKASKAASISC